MIERAAESGEVVTGTVIEVVKGGLIVDLGVRGFLPASLVDIRRVQNLDEFKGEKIECRVIELNRSRNNVVLSRRAVLEEERKEQRQEILDRLQPGMIVEGAISNIVDFGAFVDLNGVEGQNLPLRSAPAGAPEAHVTEGELANAPDYGLSDDVFAGQEGGLSEQQAGLAAAAEAFGTPEQRAAFAEPATPEAPGTGEPS